MPGVYIQEIDVLGPIAGVATSVAAFVGPALAGPANTPTLVTNWTQFINTFGVPDQDGNQNPYIFAPPMMMAPAVRGFFDNGGTMAWIVRATTATNAKLTLLDRNVAAAQPVLVISAVDEGTPGNNINVTLTDASASGTVAAVKVEVTLSAAAALGQNKVTLLPADAAKFFLGDLVLLSEGANSDSGKITAISGGVVTLEANLAKAYTAAAKLRIADLKAGGTRIRLASGTGIEAGTYLKLSQGALTENVIVSAIENKTWAVSVSPLANPYPMDGAAAVLNADSAEFTIAVNTPGVGPWANLSMDPRHSRYVLKVFGPTAVTNIDVALAPIPSSTAPPLNLPAVLAATALAGGAPDNLGALTTAHYIAGLATLEKVDEVNIVAIPDSTDFAVQSEMIAHCEKLQDRFAVLDPPAGYTPAMITEFRNLLASKKGYAALYYPRIIVTNPIGDGTITVAPSGHVMGVYARTDDQKGVHKAPANEGILNALGVELAVADSDHGPLNENSVNVIRSFPGKGILIWGARTISTSTQWRYINVRRLMLFIEESIQEGTEFAVFEPNNSELWQRLKRAVNEFLDRVWKSGALLGDKQEQAFRVRIDDELNPPATLALGQLIIEVRVAPTTPAEFIVFQIIQEPGRKIVTE
jgi:hypothetical protein